MGEDTIEETTGISIFKALQPSIKDEKLGLGLGEIDIERLSYLLSVDDLLEEILS